MMGDGEGKEELLLLGEINDADAAPASRFLDGFSAETSRERRAHVCALLYTRGSRLEGGYFFNDILILCLEVTRFIIVQPRLPMG